MKYKTINDLDARIERIVKKAVQAYYTDWKNHDRPKYMKLKGSSDRKDKTAILIVRKCGTYLLTLEEIKTFSFAATLYDYYHTYDTNEGYYLIDLERLTINRLDPSTYQIEKAA